MPTLIEHPLTQLAEYRLRHLALHLVEAGRADHLHRLLTFETDEQRNAWFEAKEHIGDTSGYIAEIATAWQLAETMSSDQCSELPLALKCRYALITASIRSLAGNIPPQLLVALLQHRVWPPAQGLAYAQQVASHGQRAQMLASVAMYLPEADRLAVWCEALDAAGAVRDEGKRAAEIVALIPCLPEPLLPGAFGAIRPVMSSEEWSRTLVALAAYLPEPFLHEALSATSIVSAWDIVKLFATLASRLPDSLLREVLETARMIQDTWIRAEVLAVLGQYVPTAEQYAVLREALTLARAITGEPSPPFEAEAATQRANVLIRLVPHLPDAERAVVLDEALAAARSIGHGMWRIDRLAHLLPHLPDTSRLIVLREVFVAAAQSDWFLPTSTWTALFQRGADLTRSERETLLDKALCTSANWDSEWISMLKAMAPYLQEHKVEHKVIKLVKTVLVSQDLELRKLRAPALAALLPHLSENRIRELLDVAHAKEDVRARAVETAYLVPYLLDEDGRAAALRGALNAIRTIGDDEERRKLLEQTELSPTKRREVVDTLGLHQSHALEPMDEPALRAELASIRRMEDDSDRRRALIALIPRLQPAMLTPALCRTLTKELRNRRDRAEVLTVLAARMIEERRTAALCEALEIARHIWDEFDRAWALQNIIPLLPVHERQAVVCEAMQAARAISEQEYSMYGRRTTYEGARKKITALTGVIPYLLDEERATVLCEALEVTRKIAEHMEPDLFDVMGCLAPHLPGPLLCKAMEIALSIPKQTWVQTAALRQLAPHLAKQPRITLAPLWRDTLHILASQTRADLLLNLAALRPTMDALGGARAIAEISRAAVDVGRWFP